ncbi:MAG: hypothetical protein EOO93_26650 [Pedobacter sp.]|nr:MAG: hypothetical protein EOO93_26650 [Pedobacter sp.]
MRNITLIAALVCMSILCFGQKVYQTGNYGNQLQKTYLTLKGVLIEKYSNKHFNWFCFRWNQETIYVNVVVRKLYEDSQVHDTLTLNNCFKLDSRQWKRKTRKLQ